jgi:hypothetical protein
MSDPANTETLKEVIARSSLGGHAWCTTCKHPDLNHRSIRPFADQRGSCEWEGCLCSVLRRMTPEEWLAWKQ